MKLCALAVALTIFGCGFARAEESPKESRYRLSYKCTSEHATGFEFSSGAPQEASFYAGDEFFLTHWRHLPIGAILTYGGKDDINESMGMTAEWWRAQMLDSYLEQDQASERGSYYFRKSSEDPEYALLFGGKCSAVGTYDEASLTWKPNPVEITCTRNSGKVSFIFNSKTARFVHSYLGSWTDGKTEIDGRPYDGDSAVIRVGSCEPYFP